ncbi:hypothetical protein B0H10DRAFT_1940748 [Mycena sp. CBHHK59/15]|nr:hypothetical protein B0H10DRAFT_1940748 [Mycena sp. CBHHK59/15]
MVGTQKDFLMSHWVVSRPPENTMILEILWRAAALKDKDSEDNQLHQEKTKCYIDMAGGLCMSVIVYGGLYAHPTSVSIWGPSIVELLGVPSIPWWSITVYQFQALQYATIWIFQQHTQAAGSPVCQV